MVAAIGCGGAKKQTKTENPPAPGPKAEPPRQDVVPVVIGKSSVSQAEFAFQKDKESVVLFITVSMDPTSTPPSVSFSPKSFLRVFKPAEDSKKIVGLISSPLYLTELPNPLSMEEVVDHGGTGKLEMILSDGQRQIALSMKKAPVQDAMFTFDKQEPTLGLLDAFSEEYQLKFPDVAEETDIRNDFLPNEPIKFPHPAWLSHDPLPFRPDVYTDLSITLDKKTPGIVQDIMQYRGSSHEHGCYLILKAPKGGEIDVHGLQEIEFHGFNQAGKIDTSSQELKEDLPKLPDGEYKGVSVGCRNVVKAEETAGGHRFYAILEIRVKTGTTVEVKGGEAK